jgi:nicotinate phosphoribosyltransferase
MMGGVLDIALRTDRYELTMLDAALASGIADRRAVFEVFARRLPAGRRYGVVAGTGSVLEAVTGFRFEPAHIDFLRGIGLSPATLAWLAGYRFTGDVHGYPEGEIYVPGSPLLTVEATFAEAVLLETVVLSVLNHDAAVAAAASRMVTAAGGRRLIEMGSRRTDPHAAVAAARSAGIAGFDATSNLLAGARYGLETAGTAAHAFTMAHLDEAAAFEAQMGAQGVGTTLLVDTWDIPNGLRTAVEVARRGSRGRDAPGPPDPRRARGHGHAHRGVGRSRRVPDRRPAAPRCPDRRDRGGDQPRDGVGPSGGRPDLQARRHRGTRRQHGPGGQALGGQGRGGRS